MQSVINHKQINLPNSTNMQLQQQQQQQQQLQQNNKLISMAIMHFMAKDKSCNHAGI